jgi:hypothetical protein
MRINSAIGTFEANRDEEWLLFGVDRKSSANGQTDANDPNETWTHGGGLHAAGQGWNI